MDETTDRGTFKQCAFTVIFLKERVQRSFFDMVEAPTGNAKTLYGILKNEFGYDVDVGICGESTTSERVLSFRSIGNTGLTTPLGDHFNARLALISTFSSQGRRSSEFVGR